MPFKFRRVPLKRQFEIFVEDWSRAAEREGHRRVADWGSVRVKKLVIPPDNSVFVWEIVDACTEIPWSPIVADHFRSADVSLERLGYYHR